MSYYKHSGSVPMVGEVCGRHENKVGQVAVIGVNEHRGRVFITYVNAGHVINASVLALSDFNSIYKYREVQP